MKHDRSHACMHLVLPRTDASESMYFVPGVFWCPKCTHCLLMLGMPVCAEGSDVLQAFTKSLALAKVGYKCAHKLYGEAQKNNDADTARFLECAIFEAVSGLLHISVSVSLHYVLHGNFCISSDHSVACCSGPTLQPSTALAVPLRLAMVIVLSLACTSSSCPQQIGEVPLHAIRCPEKVFKESGTWHS